MTLFKSSNRFEAFSDGMFAIAITLLILEIKAPQVGEHGSSAALWASLLHLWPSYLAYFLAFTTILIFWIGHHALLDHAKVIAQPILMANGLFLLTVAFLPFLTSVVAEHLRSESGSAAAAFYALANLLNSLTFYSLARTIGTVQKNHLATLLVQRKDALYGVVWCLGCAGLALISPVVSGVTAPRRGAVCVVDASSAPPVAGRLNPVSPCSHPLLEVL